MPDAIPGATDATVAPSLVATPLDTASVSTAVSGGSPGERGVLIGLLARLGAENRIVEARIHPPIDDLPGGRWLTLLVASSGDGPSRVGASWQAHLVATAFEAGTQQLDLPPYGGVTVDLRLSDGTVERNQSAYISITDGDKAALSTAPSAGDAAQEIKERARRRALNVADLRFISVSQLAPRVVISAPEPTARALRDDPALMTDVFGESTRWEGGELVLETDAGTPVFVVSFITRSGLHSSWQPPPHQG